MSGILRQATRADLAGIWRVRYAVVENTLAPGRISDAEVVAGLETAGRGWVVEEDGQIVGFAIGDAARACVWALFVDPRFEGRGHGALLHDTMVDWLWTRGLPVLWLNTGEGTRALGFYERRGWRRVGLAGADDVRLEMTRRRA